MKVLISAYACEPNKGSEPEIGWNMVKQIATYHEVWVITRSNNRTIIENELRINPGFNVNFCYFDFPYWLRFWKRGARGYHLYYYLWQIGIYFYARRLHAKFKFDIAHHVTFGSNWMPSFIALLPVPFIWGPVGSEDMPISLLSALTFTEKIHEFLRWISRGMGHHFDVFVRLTIKRARCIIDCNSRWTKDFIPSKYYHKVVRIPQNAIRTTGQPTKNWCSELDTFTVLTVARLVHWKGIRLAAEAFVALNNRFKNARMIIVGEGPVYSDLIKLFQANNVSERVVFTGTLSKNEFLKVLTQGDVFLYPSFHHGQATVVLQAMVVGLPIVCLDCDAIGEMVSDSCGIKIRPKSPKQVVRDLVNALERLGRDPNLRRQMGYNAIKRVRMKYNWDVKGKQVCQIYEGFVVHCPND